ncbi:beta-glucosidase 24 isoform X2 [Ricinus communis]|uniref:beta-glucosidase 24 isoform X2 n=1 Tax=Ricinus communis TaxID=3988 RepID=UPI00201B18E8|nr:beta-glucosidase 24 isoform X2 [Ricinus communis]
MNIIMGPRSSLLLGLLVLLIIGSLDTNESKKEEIPILKFDSNQFPDGFFWGVATSAYQTEGAANKSGRGPSIWDTFTHEYPERIDDGSNGDVAVDFYNLYKEDIRRMSKQIGMNAFRFSISWSRVIPSGRVREGVNEEGIEFYNNVIDEAINNGLEPFVTIFHWDVPQALEDKYGGFLSPNIVDYAELCYQRFGDRVKHWITLNEPFVFSTHSYESGSLAPGRCSPWVNRACQAGNSATEPYIVSHHLLLAHAAAVDIYKKQHLNGKIGITLDVTWTEPYSDSPADRAAAQRNLDFIYGWFMDPLTYGQYPRTMQTLVPDRLPKFTRKQVRMLKGSYDFIGINSYTSSYASANATIDPDPTHIRYATDSHVNLTKYKNDKPIGLQASPSWLYIYPDGIRYILNYTKSTYKDPIIYITENGIGDGINLSLEEARKDLQRIQYHEEHIWKVLRSICEFNVNVQGYFVWSFIDNMEWSSGYTIKMGLYQVDRKNKLTRRPKLSVSWFKEFLKNKASIGGPKCTLLYKTQTQEASSEDTEEL